MPEIFDKSKVTRAVLVSVVPKGAEESEYEASLAELERLADTAGAEVFCTMVQQKENPDAATYIGSGKLEELKELCLSNEIDAAIFDCELTPSQIKNIEDGIGGDVIVIDRSMLILDIFALHAKSAEGKLQVELAQLKYTVPRLVGKGNALSRLGGGIGTRGPGETKLETDKRHVKRRMDALEEQIKELASNRETQRASRDRSGVFKFAIAGYTNAGKSTLLNYLTDAGVLTEDKLFATLDPTTRKYVLPCGETVLLTDTVGFIRNLPHHLIKAFRSTLDEVAYADAIMVVIDMSDDEAEAELDVTRGLISELGAAEKPILYVCNKCDKAGVSSLDVGGERIFVSAKTGEGVDALVSAMENTVLSRKKTLKFLFPHKDSGMVNVLYGGATVQSVEYTEDGTVAVAVCDEKISGQLKKFIVKD
ncbi:MAG: GTPase HflX [Clostridiales bacterium]|nr:GTPase HflX [Clostridiales bacterium]